MTVIEELKKLREEESKLLSKLEKEKANKTFVCGCGSNHKIKDCVVIQTHWYTPPYGCSGGDHWNQGELQVICPVTDNKNRFLFTLNSNVDYLERDFYKYSAEKQFKSQYKHLFKEVVDDYDKDKRKWWNNYYVDNNHKKFHINTDG